MTFRLLLTTTILEIEFHETLTLIAAVLSLDELVVTWGVELLELNNLLAAVRLFILVADLVPWVFFVVGFGLYDSAHLNLAQSLLAPVVELLPANLFSYHTTLLASLTATSWFPDFEFYLLSRDIDADLCSHWSASFKQQFCLIVLLEQVLQIVAGHLFELWLTIRLKHRWNPNTSLLLRLLRLFLANRPHFDPSHQVQLSWFTSTAATMMLHTFLHFSY